ncbi:DUF84 family protein [Heyndrickxia sporothermodurans]|uniref:DUF84 family protein n=1 Tax=Heyndrickxia sporothermodurans TaxID=46224 RepID=UPI003D25DB3D
MKIAVGSTNPAKIKAVETGFKLREINVSVIPLKVPSDVSEQPFSDEETIKGAINRAENCLKGLDVQIGIGLEGGVTETPFGLCVCIWGALIEKGQPPIIGGGARFLLPEEIAVRLRNGEELGPVMDDFSQKKNVRKKEGAIGIFTNGNVTRDEMFLHVMKILIGQYEYGKI